MASSVENETEDRLEVIRVDLFSTLAYQPVLSVVGTHWHANVDSDSDVDISRHLLLPVDPVIFKNM